MIEWPDRAPEPFGRDRENPAAMRITWYGHAAFLIETRGTRIILDPYRSPDCGGYEPVAEPADLVIVSHDNDRYHSHLGQILPPFETIRALEIPAAGTEFRGVAIGAVPVSETSDRLPGDEVAIVHLRSEGLHVVFLGDLGHELTELELAPLRGADVVLVPAGGPPTIDYPEIPPLLTAIGSRLVIPMHFKTPKIDLKIQPVERFLEALPGVPVREPGTSSIEIDRSTLPDTMTIVRLAHAR
jgi:L-ascorbate metabolism protein UlaG (beta-lactamase superfamily)